MTFVTLGTQNFPFDRLLELVDRLIGDGILHGEVFAQSGCSTYAPKHYTCSDFLSPADYDRHMADAELVIAHAGVGTIMSALSAGKKLIVVPRTQRHQEHVDDHQYEIAEEFARKGYLLCARTYEELAQAVTQIDSMTFRKYEKGSQRVEEILEKFLENRQTRVLMVGSDLSVKGGIVSVLRNYLTSEDWKEAELSFVPTHIEGPAWKKIWFFLKGALRIRRLLAGGNFPIVHIHVSERGSFTRKAIILRMAKHMGSRVILHHHGAEFLEFYQGSSPRKQQRIRRTLAKADLNLVLSQRLVPIYRDLSPGATVECLYNVVSTPDENRYCVESREFTMLGRLAERKGTFALLETIKMIDDQLAPDIRFNLCGDGDLELVRETIRTLGIGHRIGHLGWVDGKTKGEILDRTMAHVLFSYNEGLPMAILETMGRGIVNISTNIAAIPEVITQGETGFLVEPGDREALGRILLRVSREPDLRRRISDNAFQRIRRDHSLESGVRQLERIYARLTKPAEIEPGGNHGGIL